MIPISRYQRRRAQLARSMATGVAVIPTSPERARNRDTQYGYRFDSYFYYLTGFTEPESVLVIIAGKKPKSILFCREKDLACEIWDGYRYGPKAAQKNFSFDEAYSIAKLDEMMPKLIADQSILQFPLGADTVWDTRVVGWINQVKAQVRSGITAPAEIQDVRTLLDDMRLLKDADEIKVMRHAAAIATDAHRRAMQFTKPGMMEYEVEAELTHEFRRRGAQAPAYTSIVAGGGNACVLHYVENNQRLRARRSVAYRRRLRTRRIRADITRTFPVGGTFSAAQRDVYELVLESQT